MKGQKFIPLLVIAAGLLAYHNSFTGEFILDDVSSISENPTIRHLWPIWQPLSPPHLGGLTVEGRPFINLSLAINYALGGLDVRGYHALNLTVHILAGLTLLGIVRRTLLQPALRGRFGAAANELALATAVLWTVHPLQTESVTYVIQRAESIMGLCYLLTLYCFIRGVESPLVARSTRDEPRARLWYGLCVAVCALGMASKEVMVSAPVMVMLYDRTFVSGSFREAWQRRWPLYLALASTWILLGYLLIVTVGNALTIAQHLRLSWWQYLATEPGVILYYLRLSVWPCPLLQGHWWPVAKTWLSILPPTVVVMILLGASAWALRRNPAPPGAGPASLGARQVWGFVGTWFFLILAPSSSFIPLGDPMYEHRMYLPLAAVVSLVVMGLYSVAGRQSLAVFMVMAIGLGFLTWRRNQDYRSEVTLWGDAAAKSPNSLATHYNLGVALQRAGRMQEAISHYEQALRLKPDFPEAHYYLEVTLHYHLGVALLQLGRVPEAIGHWEQVLRLKPDMADAHNNLGMALKRMGRMPEAIRHYEQALQIKPDYAEAHDNLGVALFQLGRAPEAIGHWEQALRIKPDDAAAHNNLGVALAQAGKFEDAIRHYERALRIDPDFAEAHFGLGVALERTGKLEDAIGHYEQALRLKPDYTEAQKRLAQLRAAQ